MSKTFEFLFRNSNLDFTKNHNICDDLAIPLRSEEAISSLTSGFERGKGAIL